MKLSLETLICFHSLAQVQAIAAAQGSEVVSFNSIATATAETVRPGAKLVDAVSLVSAMVEADRATAKWDNVRSEARIVLGVSL